MIIYKITNKQNGKIYIGQTKRSLKDRWQQHCAKSSKCTFLHHAIQKYGAVNFTVEQIDLACDQVELNKKEQYWIEYYDCLAPKGYNLTSGGEQNYTFSKLIKQSISERQTGENNSFYGKHHSDEIREKFREKRGGKNNPMYGSHRVGEQNPMWGKHHSEKTKQQYREMFKGGNSPKAKKVLCVELDIIFDALSLAAEFANRTPTCISYCCKGKSETAAGYHWRYVDE